MPPTLYISLDVEASGPVPGMFSLLAIGACAVVDDGTEARLLEGAGNEFKVLLKPLANTKSDPEALKTIYGLNKGFIKVRFSSQLDQGHAC